MPLSASGYSVATRRMPPAPPVHADLRIGMLGDDAQLALALRLRERQAHAERVAVYHVDGLLHGGVAGRPRLASVRARGHRAVERRRAELATVHVNGRGFRPFRLHGDVARLVDVLQIKLHARAL